MKINRRSGFRRTNPHHEYLAVVAGCLVLAILLIRMMR